MWRCVYQQKYMILKHLFTWFEIKSMEFMHSQTETHKKKINAHKKPQPKTKNDSIVKLIDTLRLQNLTLTDFIASIFNLYLSLITTFFSLASSFEICCKTLHNLSFLFFFFNAPIIHHVRFFVTKWSDLCSQPCASWFKPWLDALHRWVPQWEHKSALSEKTFSSLQNPFQFHIIPLRLHIDWNSQHFRGRLQLCTRCVWYGQSRSVYVTCSSAGQKCTLTRKIILQMIYCNKEVWIGKIAWYWSFPVWLNKRWNVCHMQYGTHSSSWLMAHFLAGIKRMFLWYICNTIALEYMRLQVFYTGNTDCESISLQEVAQTT